METQRHIRYQLLHSFADTAAICNHLEIVGLSIIVCKPEWPSDVEITQFIAVALQHGCRAFLFMGENAEHCHDVADDLLAASEEDVSNVITTFHDDESVSEVVHFAAVHCQISQVTNSWVIVAQSHYAEGQDLLRQIEQCSARDS